MKPVFSLSFGAAGGTPPYAWSASLPAWLELNVTTGEIQGSVPQDAAPGNLSLSVTLSDVLGQSLAGQFELKILSPPTTSCQCFGSSCHCSESGQCQEMCDDGSGGGGPVPPINCGCLASGCPGSSCSGCGGQCAATPCQCGNGACNASVCADNSVACAGSCVTPPTGCSDPQCACTRGGGTCPAGCPGNCGGCDCSGGLCDQVCGTNNKTNGQNPCGPYGSCDDIQTSCTCGCGLGSCDKEPGAEAAPCVCWCDCGCNEDASSLRKCGAPGPDAKCAAGSGQAPYPCGTASLSAEIKEVSFAGSNYHMLKSDDGNTSYNAPQWVDVNGDGSATTNATSGEKNYPVAFTRNTKPQIGGTFKVSGLPSGQTVKIRASSAQGLQIPETSVTSAANGIIIMPPTTASNNLVDSIQFYNAEDNTAFKIDWEISIGSSTWRALGSTNHTVYITMADPIKTAAGLMRETLFNIGCRNAKGMGSVTQGVVDAIYDDFRDMNVQKVKPSSGTLDGIGMMYWNDPPTAGFATADLLSSGDGRCGAWTRMFTDVLRSQGIDAQITAFYAPLPNLQMIVPAIQAKYPNYQGQITVEFGNPAQPQPLILVKNWDIGNHFAPIDNQGIPAQTNANPQAFFGDHFVVEFGGKYYDPSYGSNVFESQQAWEDAALDGFGLMIFANPALPDQAQSNPALPQGVTIWMWKSDPKGSAETILHTFNY